MNGCYVGAFENHRTKVIHMDTTSVYKYVVLEVQVGNTVHM